MSREGLVQSGIVEMDLRRMAGIKNDGRTGRHLLNHRLSDSNESTLELHLEAGIKV
jgi:hypothetical protein